MGAAAKKKSYHIRKGKNVGGRPRRAGPKTTAEVIRLHEDGLTLRDIVDAIKIPLSTVYRIVKRDEEY